MPSRRSGGAKEQKAAENQRTRDEDYPDEYLAEGDWE